VYQLICIFGSAGFGGGGLGRRRTWWEDPCADTELFLFCVAEHHGWKITFWLVISE